MCAAMIWILVAGLVAFGLKIVGALSAPLGIAAAAMFLLTATASVLRKAI